MADVHDTIREWWDRDSHTYDEAKSHAISDPLEAAAWRQALREALPEPPARVLDVGAGTGPLSRPVQAPSEICTGPEPSGPMTIRQPYREKTSRPARDQAGKVSSASGWWVRLRCPDPSLDIR